jgi:RND family efflux transporter MFP subunit
MDRVKSSLEIRGENVKARVLLAASCAAVLVVTWLLFARFRTKTVEAVSVDAAAAVSVAVAPAAKLDLARKLILSAEFRPYQQIDVMAKVAGYVKSIYVDVGDRVAQGQLLAVLEVPEMTDDVEHAEAGRRRNSAEFERVKDELNRAQSAHEIAHLSYTRLASVFRDKPGLIAQQEVDDAHGRDLVAEAQVSAGKSALEAAEQQIQASDVDVRKSKTLRAYTRVVAPFAGVVTKRFADTGSMIQAGTASQSQARPLVTLSQNSLLRLILPVPESAVALIRESSAVEVRVPSLDRTFPGRVARFAKNVDMATRTMETEVDVPNPDLVLIPGMFAEATLTVAEHKNALAVPVAAVADIEKQPWVMVVNSDHLLERREISVGLETANNVEVTNGLKDNEIVVIGSRSQLKPGEKCDPRVVDIALSGDGK